MAALKSDECTQNTPDVTLESPKQGIMSVLIKPKVHKPTIEFSPVRQIQSPKINKPAIPLILKSRRHSTTIRSRKQHENNSFDNNYEGNELNHLGYDFIKKTLNSSPKFQESFHKKKSAQHSLLLLPLDNAGKQDAQIEYIGNNYKFSKRKHKISNPAYVNAFIHKLINKKGIPENICKPSLAAFPCSVLKGKIEIREVYPSTSPKRCLPPLQRVLKQIKVKDEEIKESITKKLFPKKKTENYYLKRKSIEQSKYEDYVKQLERKFEANHPVLNLYEKNVNIIGSTGLINTSMDQLKHFKFRSRYEAYGLREDHLSPL